MLSWHVVRRRSCRAGAPTTRRDPDQRELGSSSWPAARDAGIAAAIVRYVGDSGSIVEAYGGHGIGRAMPMDPHFSHVGRPQSGHRLREGMAFTVEPMINAGTSAIRSDADGWTVRTADGALSAQFEHTLLIGPHGPEITTVLD